MRKRTNDDHIQFIIEADEPALFFSSKDAAETWLEAFDIEEGVYSAAFDRSGRVYEIRAYKNHGLLVAHPERKSDPNRLRNAIVRFLDARAVVYSPTDSLDQLLTKCEKFIAL